MMPVLSYVISNVLKKPDDEMTLKQRHRFLRRFVVQDRGASNEVAHGNTTCYDSFLYFIKACGLKVNHCNAASSN